MCLNLLLPFFFFILSQIFEEKKDYTAERKRERDAKKKKTHTHTHTQESHRKERRIGNWLDKVELSFLANRRENTYGRQHSK